ncbi:MAG: DNA cytosine methyltransferase [Pseudomonadota bacterium]|nr:DNA cytosine methyltransferase [Pseudomonadota bacterium]
MSKQAIPPIVAVDLFCGVGGLTYGLERAGVDVRLGVDKDASCKYPYEANNKAEFIEADVIELSGPDIRRSFSSNAVNLLAGCAPCQPFSTYSRKAERKHGGTRRGRGHPDDWKLLGRFGELVHESDPELVTMENVPPLQDQVIFREFVSSLEARYWVDYRIIECRAIGLPQTRKRLVLIASKLGPIHLPEFDIQPRTVRETISDLPPISAGEADPEDALHASCRLSDLNVRRIRASRPGGTWRDWPEELRASCHKRSTGATYPSVYGRMEWDKPAPTITTQAFGFGNGRFGHPEQERAISLREAAMLQGFPRDYAFIRDGERVSFAMHGRLIGNAVPVALGETIGRLLMDHVQRFA